MSRSLAVCLVVAAVLPATLSAKGVTTRITLTDVGRSRSVDLVDPLVLANFNVWAGPGTSSTSGGRTVVGGPGFIIDWNAGAVASRPDGLRRYEVQFYTRGRQADADMLVYVVLYEEGAIPGEGWVYLPGSADAHYPLNVRSIHRGVEGHWFRASPQWQQAVGPLLR